MHAQKMQHFAAVNSMIGAGEMKEIGRLRASLMREKCEDVVVCPKPRRAGMVLHHIPDLVKPIRRQLNFAPDCTDSEPAGEILDIFMSKSTFGDSSNLGCSPPYFCGSPPSRTDNPLVHDVHFIHQRGQISQSPLSKPNSFGRPSFGHKAAVRIEGFDCSGRDTRCSIPALA
eukprot:TRINITY_DN18583_c0_g1_i11.p1 TRINITY_DN18583_c0_g1~~TRINITY_DN18583_c0_g1_i11.p1  ORF type:complete len:172 (-),score=24.05 TRINITY_DN18583_c0_g1_i11:452-967(-)